MSLSYRDLKLLQRHLQDQPGLVCPVCGTNRFEAVDIVASPIYDTGLLNNPIVQKIIAARQAESGQVPAKFTASPAAAKADPDGQKVDDRVLPVAVVTCAHCFYVLQFAWLPILEKFRE